MNNSMQEDKWTYKPNRCYHFVRHDCVSQSYVGNSTAAAVGTSWSRLGSPRTSQAVS